MTKLQEFLATEIAAQDDARPLSREIVLARALNKARAFIQEDVDELLRSCTLPGPDGLPDRSTMEPIDSPVIARAEALLVEIDAALHGAPSA